MVLVKDFDALLDSVAHTEYPLINLDGHHLVAVEVKVQKLSRNFLHFVEGQAAFDFGQGKA
jgi:hypothetical protein